MFGGLIVLAFVLSTRSARADVDIMGLAVDPMRPIFYTTTFQSRAFSARDAVGTGSFDLVLSEPGESIAVSADGALAYVALRVSHDIAVIDLAARTVRGVIDLSATDGPEALVVGRPGRLYCTTQSDILIVDTVAGVEIARWASGVSAIGYATSGVISRDHDRYYVVDGLSPSSMNGFDVSTDAIRHVGKQCCPGCAGDSIVSQVDLTPDGRRLVVATNDDDGGVTVLDTTALFRTVMRIPVAWAPRGVATTPDGRSVLIGTRNGHILVADLESGLAWRRDTPSTGIAEPGLAVSRDGRWLAYVAIDLSTESLQLVPLDVAGLVPNLGGVRFRPVDATTGFPVPHVDIRDLRSGLFVSDETATYGLGCMSPGSYMIHYTTSTGYAWRDVPVTIAAGSWTELGEILLTPIAPDPFSPRLCGVPPSCPGTTARMSVRGPFIFPDTIVVSGSPYLTIVSQEWIGWDRLDLVVTLDAAMPQGIDDNLLVFTYRGARPFWTMVQGVPNPASPPAEVEALRVAKVSSDVRITWDGLVRDVDGCTDDVGSFELWRASSSSFVDGAAWRMTTVPELLESNWARPTGAPPDFYLVRERDAGGSLGP